MTEIIVGIDRSRGAEDALAFAAALAKVTGASLRLACAFPYEPRGALNAAYEELLLSDARGVLDAARERLADPDVPTHAIADLSPARALQHLAIQTGAALVVVGSTHRGRLGRVLPGATGERLLHGAPCSVAVVPHGWEDTAFRTVGAGFDCSPEAEAAVHGAHAVARRTGAVLRVMHVHDTTEFAAPPIVAGPAWPALRAEYEERSREALARVTDGLDGDTPVETTFMDGSPSGQLVAQSEDLDLLVLGSRGYGPAKAVMLGGVSHVVVRKAACPVIMQPRGARRGLEELFDGALASESANH